VTIKGASNSAKVVSVDRKDGTAIVHIIDTVLMPPNVYTSVYEAVTTRPELSTLGKLFAADANVKAKSLNSQFMGGSRGPSCCLFWGERLHGKALPARGLIAWG
jgi:hypothetical protein